MDWVELGKYLLVLSLLAFFFRLGYKSMGYRFPVLAYLTMLVGLLGVTFRFARTFERIREREGLVQAIKTASVTCIVLFFVLTFIMAWLYNKQRTDGRL